MKTCSLFTLLKLLELSVEGKGGQWSDPVNLDVEGTDVRVIEHRNPRSTLIIQAKRVTALQKQVGIVDFAVYRNNGSNGHLCHLQPRKIEYMLHNFCSHKV